MTALVPLAPLAPDIVTVVTETSGNTGEAITFWFCAFLAVLGALGLLFAKKTVHSALSVALTMMSMAVLYVANGAPFLGLVQVIVYTGAVMMLFLFVLMLVGVDSSDSFVETLRGQRLAAGLLVIGFAGLAVLGIGSAMEGLTATGVEAANAEHGGNAEGLAHLMFTRYLFPLEIVASLLITAALGALVLAHRERWAPRRDQRELARERMARYAQTGQHPGPLPPPGVLATSNAIGTPALLPDGSATGLSVPIPLRGEPRARLMVTAEQIEADIFEVGEFAGGAAALRGVRDADGHVDLDGVHPDDEDSDDGYPGAETPATDDPMDDPYRPGPEPGPAQPPDGGR